MVDDDESVRAALRLILEDHHEVVEAEDGETALAFVRANRVDVMVLDLLLPRTDGFQVLEHVRALPRPIPVVVISGINTSWTAATAMRLGVVDYIAKPFDDAQLLAAVAESLGSGSPAGRDRAPSARPLVLTVGMPLGLRATLSIVLADHCRVDGVADLAAALTHLKTVRPDVIVMHVTAETVSVHPDPVSRLRRDVPDRPIIVVAAAPEMRAVASRRDAALVLLRKPVSVGTLLSHIEAGCPRRQSRLPRYGDLTRRILDELAERYAGATLETLGKTVKLAPYYLSARFRGDVGIQLRAYLRTVRVEIAKMLLAETSESIDAIAAQVGLHDASHLSRVFTDHVGCRPGVYRKRSGALEPEASDGSAEAAGVVAGRPWSSLVDPPAAAVDPFTAPMIRVTGDERVAFEVAECSGELRPPRFFNAMVAQALGDTGALGYSPVGAPLGAFGDAVGAYLVARGVSVADGTMLTTSGTSSSLGLLVRALCSSGDVIAVEHPTWHVALAVFAAAGLRVLGIPVDDDGLRVDLLADALRRHRARFVFLQPAFQNPTGVSLTARRRAELLEVARRFDTLIVEDDVSAELAYDDVPPPLRTADGADRVIYLKSFSKLLTPALRVAVMVVPRRLERGIREAQHGLDPFPSALAQSVVARCLPMAEFRQHIERVRALLDARWQTLSGALETRMPEGVRWTSPRGGLCAWIEMPEPLTSLELLVDVAKRGVGFIPGSVFCLDGSGQRAARLAFGATPPLVIERGARQLGRAIRERLRQRKRSPLVGAKTAP